MIWKILIPGLCGPVFTLLLVRLLNTMPAKCFCDYDEKPTKAHRPPRVGKWGTVIACLTLTAAFVLLIVSLGVTLRSVTLCLLCVVLMMIALSDARYSIIPDELIIAGCILAALGALPAVFYGNSILRRLTPVLGAAIGGGLILAFNLIGRILYKKDALGMGDVKLMIVCGIACGHTGILLALFIGIIAAAVFFLAGMLTKKIQQGQYLPLGPFLVFGTMLFLCFENGVYSLLNWYISLF